MDFEKFSERARGFVQAGQTIALRESPAYLQECGRIWHALGEELRETGP